MQNYQKTSIRKSDKSPTIVEQACESVFGFSELYNELKRSISINGKSVRALWIITSVN
jgi:hypothetical protein